MAETHAGAASTQARAGFDSRRISGGAYRLACYVAIALGVSLPVSVALDNVLLGVLLLAWLVSARWREKYHLVRGNPVALCALALLAWIALGLTWGSGPLSDGLLYLRKYSDLLLIAILSTVLVDVRDRRRALLAFAGALVVTLVLSYALALGWLPAGGVITGDATNPTVFKRHITQNILMAFGALLFAELALEPARPRVRLLWAALSAAAVFNALFLVQGRTGYVVLAALIVLFLFRTLRWKGVVPAAVLLVLAFAAAYQFSGSFHKRVSLALVEANEWRPGVATQDPVGIRLEFYTNTLAIVREHPVLGVGTAGFASAYAQRVQGSAMVLTRNPHNQYLMTASQVGLVGLALLVLLFVEQWRCATRLPGAQERTLARGLVLTIAVGSVFNSLLIDHTESLFFAWMSGLLYAGYAPPSRPSKSS
ncbi:MAG TPA: O-antigen ligase family protein [Burkholderiales bacterium]|nr:O-antigen ligase family protein [Burkholderiales bacterium]